ncbi:hypothetical protein [uncultured Cohaesibacter sp.]|uniref:hypothetical protein n=1 Tax=uncultured Cohaesibacter sp. TaxID=1002546 RepID=UPI002AA79EF2|nr:hypothetical protein [uncultured Cohaesibacter sp.]
MMKKSQDLPEYSISTYIPVALIGLAGFLVVGYLTLFSFAEDAPVIVISSPWDGERLAITRALTPASKLIRSDFDGTFVMVLPEQADYTAKVRALGAWAVISSFGIGGCNPRPSTKYGSNI